MSDREDNETEKTEKDESSAQLPDCLNNIVKFKRPRRGRVARQSVPLDPWDPPYIPGQWLICRIMNSEPGGYAVIVGPRKLIGFLVSETVLEPGDLVDVQFVCIDRAKLLVTEPLGYPRRPTPSNKRIVEVDFEKQTKIEELDE